jgi:hypothetical protein
MSAPLATITALVLDDQTLVVDLSQLDDAAIPTASLVRQLEPILRTIGMPQDLGGMADEVHVLTSAPRQALVELTRLCAAKRIEVRDVTPCPAPVTAASITDEQIRIAPIAPPDLANDILYGESVDEIREYAIAVDPNWPGGMRHWGRVHRAARERCAAAYNALHAARDVDRCSVCGRPAHASETDDRERCVACLAAQLTGAEVLDAARRSGVPAFDDPPASPFAPRFLLASLGLPLREPAIVRALIELHRRGEIVLARVDMPALCRGSLLARRRNPALLDESEIGDGTSTFHAVELPPGDDERGVLS